MIRQSPRFYALELLSKVHDDDAYANLLLPSILRNSKLDQRDKAFTQELAFGTIRWQLTYDSIINSVSSRPVVAIDTKLLDCLRLGGHQLLKMRVPAHAAISETVNLVRDVLGEGVVGFANGILRRISEKSWDEWLALLTTGKSELQGLSIRYSHPEWIVSALKQSLAGDGLQDELENLLAANNTNPKVNLVALPGLALPTADSESTTRNAYSPIGFSLTRGNPELLAGFSEGVIRVQDEGSQLAALALTEYRQIEQGESWLDMCSGPGGKAAVLAAISSAHNVDFTANEVQPHRAKLVLEALKSFPEAKVLVRDGIEFGSTQENSFDRILVDAPCTGLGALRRRPEARWRKSSNDLKDLTKLQFDLLKSAFLALKPGGLLLYVTCSPHLSETTAIIVRATKELDCEVLDLTSFMTSKYRIDGLPRDRKTVQLHTHRDGTDSMFMALMSKPVR